MIPAQLETLICVARLALHRTIIRGPYVGGLEGADSTVYLRAMDPPSPASQVVQDRPEAFTSKNVTIRPHMARTAPVGDDATQSIDRTGLRLLNRGPSPLAIADMI